MHSYPPLGSVEAVDHCLVDTIPILIFTLLFFVLVFMRCFEVVLEFLLIKKNFKKEVGREGMGYNFTLSSMLSRFYACGSPQPLYCKPPVR